MSGSFVADSAYTYLIIGNLFSNALTDTLHFAPDVPEWGVYSYAVVDAVCVSPTPDVCELLHGVEQIADARPFIYPNPASDVLVIGNAAGRDAVILDMLGKRVWSGRTNTDRFALDVGSWARGAYVLHMMGVRSGQIVKFVLAE